MTCDEQKAEAFFNHFDGLLSSPGRREAKLDFSALGIPTLGDVHLDYCFSEDEVWRTILEVPPDKPQGQTVSRGLSTVLPGRLSKLMS